MSEISSRGGFRRFSRAIAASAILAGTTLSGVVAAPTAQADTCCGAATVCFANYFCVWEDPNYGGKWVRQIGNGDSVNRRNVGDFLNDQISALWNRSGGKVCVSYNTNYSGLTYGVKAGDSHRDLRNDSYNDFTSLNDNISSWRACS